MWLGWILGSAGILSAYDLCKKASVKDNAVFPVLLISTLSGWLAVGFYLVIRGTFAATVAVSPSVAAFLLIKSCIVGASWTSTYFALRTLPITSAAPIRATGPFWTLIGAILLFSEVPTVAQACGMALTLFGCFLFSLSAKGEGVSFWRNRSIALAFLGTVLGSCSALYDKHLLKGLALPTETVLWWFLGGMAVIYGLATLMRSRNGSKAHRFEFRWTIPLVGILLALSDACYFNAVGAPDTKISVLSIIRRSSVALTFVLGGAIFRETNLLRKGIALAAILSGVVVLCIK